MIAKNQIKSVEKCGRNDKIWGQRIWSMQTDIVVKAPFKKIDTQKIN